MIGGGKKEKVFKCTSCREDFSNLDAQRTCSNCFACTGCEVYICPNCGNEVEIIPMKKMSDSGK